MTRFGVSFTSSGFHTFHVNLLKPVLYEQFVNLGDYMLIKTHDSNPQSKGSNPILATTDSIEGEVEMKEKDEIIEIMVWLNIMNRLAILKSVNKIIQDGWVESWI